MIAQLILILVSLYTIYLFKKNKLEQLTITILVFTIVAPNIGVGSLKFDSLYVYAVLLSILCAIFLKKIVVNDSFKNLFVIFFCILLIYFLSWIFKSRINIFSTVMSFAGILKFLTLLAVVQTTYMASSLKLDLIEMLRKFFSIGLCLNAIATIYQILFPIPAYNLFSDLYSSNTATYYLSGDEYGNTGGFVKGTFTRYFGLFDSPMLLGCFSLLATIFFLYLILYNKNKTFKNIFFFMCSIALGILSTTKSYLLGFPIIIILMLITFSITSPLNYNKIKKILIIFFFSVCLLLVGKNIIELLTQIKPNLAYYLEFFKNPQLIFSTRLGEDGYINLLLEVVKDNLFFGVGPSSVKGEPIADSAYLVLLHHGGLTALFLVCLLFIRFFTVAVITKKTLAIYFIIGILFLSSGMTVLIGSNMTLFLYFYLINLSLNYKKITFYFWRNYDT